jgi:GNAT superfamily N-acetyltransferase
VGRGAADFPIRRVGFRAGTDAELAALHLVASEVDGERRPDRSPQPLASYIAFARSLPAMFHDHTWLAEAPDGTVVGSAACWSNAAGDPELMECDVCVRRDHRRQGIGALLFDAVCRESEREGRATLLWSTFDAVPAADAFSRRFAGRVARVNRTSELRLLDVDWGMVHRWSSESLGQAHGYRLETVDGVFPRRLRRDAAAFHHIMQTAPRDDLDAADVVLDEEHVADLDRHLVEAGRDRWTLFVRDPSGVCVGGTEVTYEPWEPSTALQQNTGIDAAHRGLGLAKWAKAVMLQRIRSERPQVDRLRTGNAFSNGAMLAINDALGFRVISTHTEWQTAVTDARRALADRRPPPR